MTTARVLVIDDEQRERRAYAKQIGEAGFEAIEAKDERQAVKLLKDTSIDLVVMDIKMPGIDGFRLLQRLRDGDPNVEVVLMVDKTSPEVVRRARASGAFECITKPLNAGKVKQLVARVIGRGGRRTFRFRNRLGQDFPVPSFKATEVKNSFGRMLDTTLRKGALVIIKHEEPTAVLLAWDEFEALDAARRQSPIDSLAGEFDSLLASMQTSAARKGLKRAFDMKPEEIGKAAVAAAARRHG